MSTTFTPFGYRYEGSQVSVKLRFTKEKFFSASLSAFGKHFMSKSGHIIFEATMDTRSEEFEQMTKVINSMNTPSK